jgi:hypothetical protein
VDENNGNGNLPTTTTGGAIVTSRQSQEVQAQALIAYKKPRDQVQAYNRIMEACKRQGLAEKAVYSYPRGGQTVSGPSIRLAEAIAKEWGNISCGVIELDQKAGKGNLPGESTMMAYAWDVETNYRVEKVFTVRHKRDTKQGSKLLTDERDIYEIAANNGARRLRSCILGVIPGDITEDAVEACNKTLEKGGDGPLIDRVKKMVVTFSEYSVSQAMLEKRLGHKIEATTAQELVTLRNIYNSLRDGMSDRAQWFEIEGALSIVPQTQTVADEVGKAQEPAAAPAQAATEPKTEQVSQFVRKVVQPPPTETTVVEAPDDDELTMRDESKPAAPNPLAPKTPEEIKAEKAKLFNETIVPSAKALGFDSAGLQDFIMKNMKKTAGQCTLQELEKVSIKLLEETSKKGKK